MSVCVCVLYGSFIKVLHSDMFYYSYHYLLTLVLFLIMFLCVMKKILLLLITLTTFTNVSYASFPVTET